MYENQCGGVAPLPILAQARSSGTSLDQRRALASGRPPSRIPRECRVSSGATASPARVQQQCRQERLRFAHPLRVACLSCSALLGSRERRPVSQARAGCLCGFAGLICPWTTTTSLCPSIVGVGRHCVVVISVGLDALKTQAFQCPRSTSWSHFKHKLRQETTPLRNCDRENTQVRAGNESLIWTPETVS